MKNILKQILNGLTFVPLLMLFNVVIFPLALIVVLIRKISKQANYIDSEVTSFLHKTFRN